MKVVRTSEMQWAEGINKGRFSQRRKDLGGDKMRCGLWELAPGKTSFPMHRHMGTEEAMFVLSGKATVKTEEGETPVGPGDFVTFPTGGPAHQLVNDGAEPLVYVAMSSGVGIDVVQYPKSGKIACAYGAWPKITRFIFEEKNQTDYMSGEE